MSDDSPQLQKLNLANKSMTGKRKDHNEESHKQPPRKRAKIVTASAKPGDKRQTTLSFSRRVEPKLTKEQVDEDTLMDFVNPPDEVDLMLRDFDRRRTYETTIPSLSSSYSHKKTSSRKHSDSDPDQSLKDELDLFDDSDLDELLRSTKNPPKKVKLRHTMNQLLSECKEFSSEERKQLEAEMERDLDDFSDEEENIDLDSFVNEDNEDDEQVDLNNISNLIGEESDFVWHPRYAFVNWNNSLKDSTYSQYKDSYATRFSKTRDGSSDTLGKFLISSSIKGKPISEVQIALIKGSFIQQFSPLSEPVSQWLFQLLCFYEEDRLLTRRIFDALESEFTAVKDDFASEFPYAMRERNTEEASGYRFKFAEFLTALKAFGVTIHNEDEMQPHYLSKPPPHADSFPFENVILLLRLLELSITHIPKRYSDTELITLLKITSGFLIDPLLTNGLLVIQSLFSTLLNAYFSEEPLANLLDDDHLQKVKQTKLTDERKLKISKQVKTLCKELYHESVSLDASHLFLILTRIFCGPSVSSTEVVRIFKSQFALYVGKRILKSVESNDDSDDTMSTDRVRLYPQPDEILSLLSLLDINLEKQYKKSKFNFSKIFCVIGMVDMAMDKTYYGRHNFFEFRKQLRDKILETNTLLPENSGKFFNNIGCVRVKEYISNIVSVMTLIDGVTQVKPQTTIDKFFSGGKRADKLNNDCIN